MVRHEYRRAWEEWAADAPISYHLTVTFGLPSEFKVRLPLSDAEARKCLSYYVHLINQRLFGRDYKERGRHLQGVVTQELHENGNPHFHLLVLADIRFHASDRASLEDICMRIAGKVHKLDGAGEPWVNRKTGRLVPIMSPKGVSVQPVWNKKGAAGYIMKDTFDFGYLFGTLTENGVEWDREAEDRRRRLDGLYGR